MSIGWHVEVHIDIALVSNALKIRTSSSHWNPPVFKFRELNVPRGAGEWHFGLPLYPRVGMTTSLFRSLETTSLLSMSPSLFSRQQLGSHLGKLSFPGESYSLTPGTELMLQA